MDIDFLELSGCRDYVVFMDEEGKRLGSFSHLVISSSITDHRADPLILNFKFQCPGSIQGVSL